MSSKVRVLSVTHVLADQTICPAAAAPNAGGDVVKLSFFDTIFISLRPTQRLFFYEGPDLPPFPELVRSLQSSLATTLAVFPPLTGKLTYRPSSDDIVIDCSLVAVSPGVKFIEAEYEYNDSAGGVDMHRLATDDEHHPETFMQLVPELEVQCLPAPVLAVQVTKPATAASADSGGGSVVVAVGVSFHHVACDGQAFWQFMKAWSTASRKVSPAAMTTGVISLPSPTTFDRPSALYRHLNGDELARKFLRVVAPSLPLVDYQSPVPDVTRQRRKTFLLRPNQIESLKQQIMLARTSDVQGAMAAPTTYVAVLSLVWTSLVRAKFTSDTSGDAYFQFPADCRRRLRPPVDDGYFGNCIKVCQAKALVADLCAGGDRRHLGHAAAALQKAIREQLVGDDLLADIERWRHAIEVNVPEERVALAASSHRFMAYETDFGWGAPRRVELVSVYRMELVALVAASAGGVQVSMALDGAHMDAFECYFLQALTALHQY
ncbi:hypothetical protein GUJ93_ZPchr0006g42957 [Zizania palustris]|uniref:Uncharacterized protein n=1 Tax=Zizania palustris TaxID=103762 RepID=A0A8J5S795_ZIZPA|nr:hypothetical protein GUJ93_ZPchr0006g42957 [Zizania palustris]